MATERDSPRRRGTAACRRSRERRDGRSLDTSALDRPPPEGYPGRSEVTSEGARRSGRPPAPGWFVWWVGAVPTRCCPPLRANPMAARIATMATDASRTPDGGGDRPPADGDSRRVAAHVGVALPYCASVSCTNHASKAEPPLGRKAPTRRLGDATDSHSTPGRNRASGDGPAQSSVAALSTAPAYSPSASIWKPG